MITTVMLTAYDGLSPWYRAAVRVQKPRRNELSLGLQTSLDGFRDHVSQVLRLLVWYESGEWKHRFSDEEHDLFMPEASYEEFVEAQQ